MQHNLTSAEPGAAAVDEVAGRIVGERDHPGNAVDVAAVHPVGLGVDRRGRGEVDAVTAHRRNPLRAGGRAIVFGWKAMGAGEGGGRTEGRKRGDSAIDPACMKLRI